MESYRNDKITSRQLQGIMWRESPENKYQDSLTTHRHKENISTTRVAKQFRIHLTRQEFARQKLVGVSSHTNPVNYELRPSSVCVSDEEFLTVMDVDPFDPFAITCHKGFINFCYKFFF